MSSLDLPDVTLEQALRRVVQSICRTGELQNLTVKRVRKATEEDLKLPEEFFKQHLVWKDKSKNIIEEEAETQADTASDGELTILRAAASAGAGTPNSPKKRPPPTQDISRKRQKLDQDSEVDLPSSGRLGKPGVSIDKKKSKKALGEVQQSIDDDHQSLDDVALPEGDQESSGIAQEETLQSDMSEVLDDEPKKKPKKRRSEASTSQTKNIDRSKEKKEKKPKDENLDPDAEEIKRLQGWLVKCGMRKMWYKELQPYDGQKAKIRHLKDMLAEVGMVGRYSMEKATQIRDARELKSELEAVQEGAKQWGKADSDAEGKARPRRRVAKGLQHLDFLNDDDGEETD